MQKHEWFQMLASLQSLFPGSVSSDEKIMTAWFGVVADLEIAKVSRACAQVARECEYIRPGTNIGALIRNRCVPVLTPATVEANLHRALELNRRPDGDPYGYLKNINPRLCEMAESANLFSRDMTYESIGFRVRDVARQFSDEYENVRRGFVRNEPLPPNRQIEGPAKRPTPEEQQEINRSGFGRFRETMEAMKKNANP